MISTLDNLSLLGAIFAALAGLAFGSFLNVCLSRIPEGESVATPRSHCRNCPHTLAWWENLPLLSWILLRGRCRNCKTPIGIRYPLVELAVGILWTGCWLRFSPQLLASPETATPHALAHSLIQLAGYALLSWLLVALATLDAEHFWLPDAITLPGTALGILVSLALKWSDSFNAHSIPWLSEIWARIVNILIAAGVVLFIRLAYWLIRRREGMGLGDAKLMAMLASWLGLIGAIESFILAILGATAAALIYLVLLIPKMRSQPQAGSHWNRMQLPLGTFLCLAAMSQILFPDWFWTWWSQTFLPGGHF